MPKNDRFIFKPNDDDPNGGQWWLKDEDGTRPASPEYADALQDFDDVVYDGHGNHIAWRYRNSNPPGHWWWNENTKEIISSEDVAELVNVVAPSASMIPGSRQDPGAESLAESLAESELPSGDGAPSSMSELLLGNIGGAVGAGGVPYGPIPGLPQEDIIYRTNSITGEPVVDKDGNLVVDWQKSEAAAKAREALLYPSEQGFRNPNEYLTYLLKIGNWEEANRVREFINQPTVSETEQNRIREAPKGLEELIVNALVAGDTEKAQALSNFRNQPTVTERFDRAMQYAKSPADQLTLIAMQRGQLPISTRAPLFDLQGNINPDYQAGADRNVRIPWTEMFVQRGGVSFPRNALVEEQYRNLVDQGITPDVASEAVASDNETAIHTRFGFGSGDYNRPAASTGSPPSALTPSAETSQVPSTFNSGSFPATGGFGSADMNMLVADTPQPTGPTPYQNTLLALQAREAEENAIPWRRNLGVPPEGAVGDIVPAATAGQLGLRHRTPFKHREFYDGAIPNMPSNWTITNDSAPTSDQGAAYNALRQLVPNLSRAPAAIPSREPAPVARKIGGMQAPLVPEKTWPNQAGVGARNTPYKRPWLNQPGHTNPIDWDARANPTGIASHIGGQVSAPLTMPNRVPGAASIGDQTLIPPSQYPGNINESLRRIRPVEPRAEIPKTGGKRRLFTPEYLSGQTRSKMSQAEADTRFGALALHIGEDAARQFMTDEAASTSISRRRGGTSRIRSAPSRISRRR